MRYGSELNVIAVQADANAMGCVRSPLALTMKEWKNQVLQENPIIHSSAVRSLNLRPLCSAAGDQLIEPPDADPLVRWCGRGEVARPPPIPIGTKIPPSGTWRPYAALSKIVPARTKKA